MLAGGAHRRRGGRYGCLEADVERWRALVGAVDPGRERFGRLVLETADGRALPYPDASFDAAVSVSVIEHIPGKGDATAMSELARVLRPGGILVLTFPFASEARDVHVDHDLYGQRYEGTPLFFYRHYSPDTLEQRLLAASHFGVDDRAYWTKQGVQSAQAGLHRLVPARWELGKALGPVLPLIGARALVPGSPEEPGVEGVLGLALRRA